MEGDEPPNRSNDDSSRSCPGRTGGSSGGNRTNDCLDGGDDGAELSAESLANTLVSLDEPFMQQLGAHLKKEVKGFGGPRLDRTNNPQLQGMSCLLLALRSQ